MISWVSRRIDIPARYRTLHAAIEALGKAHAQAAWASGTTISLEAAYAEAKEALEPAVHAAPKGNQEWIYSI